MSIECKRVDFNNFKNSLVKLYSTVVTDTYNNKINMVCLQLNNKVNMDVEIIGGKVYIHKHIEENTTSDNEILSFIVDNIDTIYTLKIIIKNNMNENKLIYLGNYTFNIITHKINKEHNIKLIIKKKIIPKKNIEIDGKQGSEHESEHESEHDKSHELEQEDNINQGDDDTYINGCVDDDEEEEEEEEEDEDDEIDLPMEYQGVDYSHLRRV